MRNASKISQLKFLSNHSCLAEGLTCSIPVRPCKAKTEKSGCIKRRKNKRMSAPILILEEGNVKAKQQLVNTGSTSSHIQGDNLSRETNYCKTDFLENFSIGTTKPDISQVPGWKKSSLCSDAVSFLGQNGSAELHLWNKEEIPKIQIFAVSMHVIKLIDIYTGGVPYLLVCSHHWQLLTSLWLWCCM